MRFCLVYYQKQHKQNHLLCTISMKLVFQTAYFQCSHNADYENPLYYHTTLKIKYYGNKIRIVSSED